MEHKVVRARCGPGLGAGAELAERHPCEVVEAVVRLVRQDEGGDAGVDRKVLLVDRVRVRVGVRVRVRGRGRGRIRVRVRVRLRLRGS